MGRHREVARSEAAHIVASIGNHQAGRKMNNENQHQSRGGRIEAWQYDAGENHAWRG